MLNQVCGISRLRASGENATGGGLLGNQLPLDGPGRPVSLLECSTPTVVKAWFARTGQGTLKSRKPAHGLEMGSTGIQKCNGRAGDGHSTPLESGDTFNCQRQRSSAHRLWQCALHRSCEVGFGRSADGGEARCARAGGLRSLRAATFCSRPSSHVVLDRAQSNRGLGGATMRQSVRLCRKCVTEPFRTTGATRRRRNVYLVATLVGHCTKCFRTPVRFRPSPNLESPKGLQA